jgi:hypothetical protein
MAVSNVRAGPILSSSFDPVEVQFVAAFLSSLAPKSSTYEIEQAVQSGIRAASIYRESVSRKEGESQ